MANQFPPAQQAKLDTCDERLKLLVNEVHQQFPVVVVYGHRGESEQTKAYVGGFSKVQYPNSPHNKYPSRAVDLAPYPLDWNNTRRFIEMYHVVMSVAERLGIKIRAGADFNQDGDLTNDKFRDLPHFELAEK
jgi:hypothetical protein